MERWCKQKSNWVAKNPKLNIINLQRAFKLKKKLMKEQVLALLQHEEVYCNELSVYWLSNKRIKELHQQFFQDSSATDCISIPIDDTNDCSGYRHLGEIFICPQVAYEYAKSHEKEFYEEVTLYLIHGFLHLIGYNDIRKKEKLVMRKKEKALMSLLKRKRLL